MRHQSIKMSLGWHIKDGTWRFKTWVTK